MTKATPDELLAEADRVASQVPPSPGADEWSPELSAWFAALDEAVGKLTAFAAGWRAEEVRALLGPPLEVGVEAPGKSLLRSVAIRFMHDEMPFEEKARFAAQQAVGRSCGIPFLLDCFTAAQLEAARAIVPFEVARVRRDCRDFGFDPDTDAALAALAAAVPQDLNEAVS